ncbi:MAG: glucose-6-phosphate isomerase, partial [Chloroflexi bacterium]|nr:glucose-6-phosphate isomerase [Chloroflexota bacterium]
STGKEGKGIVPVAGEPLAAPDRYGADRLFVYLRLEGDDNAATDAAIEEIQASGQPVFRLDLRDKYDVGAEFYRWEMATTIAGAVLGINPFDQPNVQAAKDMTEGVLAQFESQGKLPEMSASGNLQGLLADAKPGDYLAIMAYVRQTPEVDRALASLREKVMERHGIATTMGYGPRFLHSTGQLHKGGPNSGLFLQLTADLGPDVSIPGQAFTFGVLADAQALGDLQALQAAQRRASRVHLGSDVPAGILALARELG